MSHGSVCMRRVAVLAALTALAVAFSAALAAPVWADQRGSGVIGPYVQNIGKDNATVCWATPTGAVTPPATDGEPTSVHAYDHSSVLLRGLQPDTAYKYTVSRDGTDLGTVRFTTFPKEEKPFNFIAFGDTRTPHPYQPLVVARILLEKPEMVFNTGDVVTDGWNIGQWETFFDINHQLMLNVPYYPVLGNHENDAPLYFQFFSLPGNERYYSFDRATTHFIVLDSNGLELPLDNQSPTKEAIMRLDQRQREYLKTQLAWLKEDLEASRGAKYVFVFFHHPLYSVMSKRQGGAKEMRDLFGTIFQDYKVTAVFHGHDHHYARNVAGGVPFVTTGGGGANLYETDAPQPETVKFARLHHYVRVDVGADKAKARVVDLEGQTIDEWEMPARPQPAAPPTAK